MRPVDPAYSALESLDISHGVWRPDSSSIITVEGSEVLLYRIPGGSLLGRWRADGYTSYSLVRTAWSPDRQRVLIVGQDSQGRNALFVITVP